MKTVAYASFCCLKDKERAVASLWTHLESHRHHFDEAYFVFQRCTPIFQFPVQGVVPLHIAPVDYPALFQTFNIPYPDPVFDELTHGWSAPHFWAHHMVNHLRALLAATTDYIVFADADCYIKESPEGGPSWVEEGIALLESKPDIFVVSPSDGGPERYETIMSQQMFLVDRKRMLEMEFLPWDGKFIEGGPFQEYYGLMEGFIARYMTKHGLFRYVLPPEFRYWHGAWH